jgi:hypothetical protein
MHMVSYSLIGLVELVLVIWALADLLTSRRPGTNLLLWIVVIILIPVLGSVLYLILGRGKA